MCLRCFMFFLFVDYIIQDMWTVIIEPLCVPHHEMRHHVNSTHLIFYFTTVSGPRSIPRSTQNYATIIGHSAKHSHPLLSGKTSF